MEGFGVNINSEDLSKTARKYRKDFLMMPVLALSASLPYVNLRPGIRSRRQSENCPETSSSDLTVKHVRIMTK